MLTALVGEYSALFPDAVFHIGSDETAFVGKCTQVRKTALRLFPTILCMFVPSLSWQIICLIPKL